MESPSSPPGATWVVTADDAEATRALGARFGALARGGAARGTLLVLHGDLGAGKTVFVQGVAAGLGVAADAKVVSPTFTIARSYPTARPDLVLHHLDAYRLDGGEALEAIGFEEMCGVGCVTCVEWGSRVDEALPEERIDLWIEVSAMDEPYVPGEVPRAPRRLVFTASGPDATALLAALRDGTLDVRWPA